jgi:hypothetical protein
MFLHRYKKLETRMDQKWFYRSALAAILGFGSLQAGIVYFAPNVTFTAQQPVNAIIIDGDGNTVEKTFVYDPAVSGIDVGIQGAPMTSIYFPDSNTRYIWYNGYWVGEDGYYWDRGHRGYVNMPTWNVYWGGYWNNHWHDSWHRHWNEHRADVSWRYRGNEHWHERRR